MTSRCSRCGTCCAKGGPALHIGDAGLLEHIPMTDIVCLRAGEPAYDPRTDSLQPLASELLKIRGKGRDWECVYYLAQDKSCAIYAHRPLECRTLYCGDNAGILRAMDEPALTRGDVVPGDSALRACMVDHDRTFPVGEALRLAGEDGGAARGIRPELDDLIRRELLYRRVLGERAGAEDRDLWAYLGRPLWLVLVPLNPAFSRYERD